MSGRIVGAKKRHFKVEGPVQGIGHIRVYRWALNRDQAVKLVALRFENDEKYKHLRIYLGDCTVTDITGDKQWKG